MGFRILIYVEELPNAEGYSEYSDQYCPDELKVFDTLKEASNYRDNLLNSIGRK